jgi:hypothetical protein
MEYITENYINKNILEPLCDLIHQYKSSKGYNIDPESGEDAGETHYFEKQLDFMFLALDYSKTIDQETYFHARDLIQEIRHFIDSFERADGLPKRYFRINPHLKFYRAGFTLMKDGFTEELEKGKAQMQHFMPAYLPTQEEMKEYDAYFQEKKKAAQRFGLEEDEDDWFMEELEYTLRELFEEEFRSERMA